LALVLDTGPLYAALDQRDAYHAACRRLIESSIEELVIPIPVLGEVDYFILARGTPSVRNRLLTDIVAGAYRLEGLVARDIERIRDICATYADADVGFVDAAVLAIVERLGEPKLATLDRRHFGMLRPRHVPALTLLP
jgi:predicted nucleic acid-binding protein